MRKIIFSLLLGFSLLPTRVQADEGMWFLMFLKNLNEKQMQEQGLRLSAEEIYSINNSSLKDAIVQFAGGCTASIISKDGLVLTNHHCGYEQIAALSTPEQNHLRDGFWAKNHQAELFAKNTSVRFFVRMDNVTERMLSVVRPDMSEQERHAALNKEIAQIQKEHEQGGKYTVSVRSFFQGNEFYYFVYQDFKDVRLVGTPEESIGKFGGDTDNWEWPRQTGDFALFRVYTDKNGHPAEYSPENIPLQTNNYLKVNTAGVKEGDFAMIMGYPGRTNRWESSYWVEQRVKYAYPAWVEGSKTAMDAMKAHMDADPAIRLKYASKYSNIANYWKNRQGMIDALSAHQTAKKKQKAEKKFAKWANKEANKVQYQSVMPTIALYFDKTNQKSADDNYLLTLLRASNLVTLPLGLGKELQGLAQTKEQNRQAQSKELQEKIKTLYHDEMDISTEKSILAASLGLYAQKAHQLPDFLKQVKTQYNNDLRQYVEDVFASSLYGNYDKLSAFINKPDMAQHEQDPLSQLSQALLSHYHHKTEQMEQLTDQYEKAFRKFVQGMRVSGVSQVKYPDANSTLRLTYGSVKSLPADKRNFDVKQNYYTTFATLAAKYKKGDPEFDMPERMLDLHKNKQYGAYADKDGTLHINFLTNNDITGGNSGSPVLNGKGELIGLAFDGNIEAMAGDVIFDKKLQRTINVDIRYVLWVIDTYAGAKHIVDEMSIKQ